MFACKVKYQNFGFECLRIDAKKFELKLGKAKVKFFCIDMTKPRKLPNWKFVLLTSHSIAGQHKKQCDKGVHFQ